MISQGAFEMHPTRILASPLIAQSDCLTRELRISSMSEATTVRMTDCGGNSLIISSASVDCCLFGKEKHMTEYLISLLLGIE